MTKHYIGRLTYGLMATLVAGSAGATELPAFVSNLNAGVVATISDGDFVALTYATGQLAPESAGFRDLLTIISLRDGEPHVTSIPVSNSVNGAPETMTITGDGQSAFVVERLASRTEGARTIRDLKPGRKLFAIDLSDAKSPKIADETTVGPRPAGVAVDPRGERVAVIHNTPDSAVLTILPYRNHSFGTAVEYKLTDYGITEGGANASNVHWHPSGRFLAINFNTWNRVAFFEVKVTRDRTELQRWGNVVEVGRDPYAGRFTGDGRFYLTSNWGRNFKAESPEDRIPTVPSTVGLVRLAAVSAGGRKVRHEYLGGPESDLNAEGIAVSPDGRLVATVNMRGTAFPPDHPRFDREATVSLLQLEPENGKLTKIADYSFEGALPEGGSFDLTGDYFLASVFQGHPGADPEHGAGLEVFRVIRGDVPRLERLGRIPMPHGVHHVRVAP